MDERGDALERLDEVRLERVDEQRGHGAGGVQLLGGHTLARAVAGDGDRAQARAQVVVVARHRDDRHHLRGRGDVEARLPGRAVGAAAEADDDATQRAVVHVEAASPGDGQWVDAEGIPVEQVRFDERGEQVVGGADRMDVAGEMEVHELGREQLSPAAARSPAFQPEDGAERPRASTREIAVVVLPSPAFVGVIAVTQTSLPSRGAAPSAARLIFAA
jgi:hypothetical protein